MLVDPKGLGKPPVFSGREEHFYVWTKKVENHVSGVFPNVREALAFAAESQDVVTAATVTKLRRLQREMDSSSWSC